MGKFKKRADGRYATTITMGHKPDGSPNKIFLAAKTEKELKQKVLDAQMKIQTRALFKEADTPLKDYSDSWFKTYKCSVGLNTTAMYRNILDHYILPELGHFPLNKLRRSDIQELINSNRDHPRTCEQIRLTLIQILNSAIDDRLIQDNVAKKVTLPVRHKTERRALTQIEKDAIKTADFSLQERAFVYLLFYFGLRRGEALALTKSDINLKTQLLTVNKAVIFDVNTPIVKVGAKSDAGNRTIPIPAEIFPFLRDFLKTVNTFYLFPGKHTETLSKTQYVKLWNRIVRKMNDAVLTDKEKLIGVQKILGLTAHIFRHNYCTMLYYSGVSTKKAVDLMGHSNVKMIMEA